MKVFKYNRSKILRKDVVGLKKCLQTAFMDDPHINWYINGTAKGAKEQSKYDIFMLYNIWFAYTRGFIVHDDARKGAALFVEKSNYVFSLRFIALHFKMLYKFGVVNILRILSLQKKMAGKQSDKSFLHLLLLGVFPEFQKQGIGRSLVEYGIDIVKSTDKPLLLETSTINNVKFYKNLGFILYDTLDLDDGSGLTIYFLKYFP